MNLFLLYLLLFKAVITSFSGMASLPIVRQDFVVTRHILTDRQLNTAIVAGRTLWSIVLGTWLLVTWDLVLDPSLG